MEKLDRLGWVVSQVYRIGDQRIEVRTTSYAFAEWVDYVLGTYRVEQDFEDNPYFSVVVEDHAPSVAGGRRFHVLYRMTSAIVRTLDLGTLARTFLSEIERLRVPFREDSLHLHGALLLVRGRPILVPGYLVSRMSSQTRRAERAGITLPGHSTLQVNDDGFIVPLERVLNTPADAYDRFAASFETQSDPDRMVISEPVRPEAVLQLAHALDVELRPVSRSAALYRLGTLTMNLPVLGGRSLGILSKLIDGSPCYETTWAGERSMLDLLAGRAEGSGLAVHAEQRSENTSESR